MANFEAEKLQWAGQVFPRDLPATVFKPGPANIARRFLKKKMISFSDRVVVPSNVLIRFLDQESVLLNLNTERYFGLDSVGTRMWQLVTSSPTIEGAYLQLMEEFEVNPHVLRSNLADLLDHLQENGLITAQPADVGTASPV